MLDRYGSSASTSGRGGACWATPAKPPHTRPGGHCVRTNETEQRTGGSSLPLPTRMIQGPNRAVCCGAQGGAVLPRATSVTSHDAGRGRRHRLVRHLAVHALLGAATGHAMGVISFLLYLVGAGLLFAAGFLTASVSWGLGAAVQWALLRK